MTDTATPPDVSTDADTPTKISLPDDLISQLIEAGVHFGHRSSRWNPKMSKYIFAKRNHIHIIDLKETVRGILRAMNFLEKIASQGGEVLIVGTKRQAQEAVREVAVDAGMHFVTERWLGGTLTNHPTIRKRLDRLEELEQLERSGQLQAFSKKMQVRLKREHDKIFRNLEGVRTMADVPTAVIVVDARRETNALKEAIKLNIPTLALIDTDSDPHMVDISIPGNDDATRAIRIVLNFLGEGLKAGRKQFKSRAALRAKEMAQKQQERREQPAPKPAQAPGMGVRKVVVDQNAAANPADGVSSEEAAPAADAKPKTKTTKKAATKKADAPKAEETKAEETKAEGDDAKK